MRKLRSAVASHLTFHAILFYFVYHAARASIVRIDQGILDGKILKSRNGVEFHAFYGIPYAQAPTGQLRFEPPKLPPPSWQGTKDATKEPPFCPQNQMDPTFKKGYFGSEDCLYLQVFTRNITPVENGVKPTPVLVYFHGGFFKNGGSALYGAHFFMDKPVVMVTVNSRLGVLGFLSSGDSINSGNYGLKDQTAALLWIRRNIRSFGGDPSAVTIMGQSSGGACAHLHTLSPLSKNLFHRAIMHSGTAVNTWSVFSTDTAQKIFNSFKQHANCSKSSIRESVACLRAFPPKKIVELEATYLEIKSRPNIFKPVVELSRSESAFLTTNPDELAYVSPQMPLILGFNSNEWGPRADSKTMMVVDRKKLDVELLKKLQYDTPTNPELARNITVRIKQLYFGKNISDSDSITIVSNDLRMKSGVLNSIQNYPGTRFAFEYDFRDSTSEFGAGHGEELKLLFPSESNSELNETQKRVSETMIKYWSNFVLTGDPNIPDRKLPTKWIPVKNDPKVPILHISNNRFQMKSEFVSPELSKLWADFKEVKCFVDSIV